jgi:hypothetical protein
MGTDDPPDEWWPVDAETGERVPPDGTRGEHPGCLLGDVPLDAAGTVALDINATFGSARHFTEGECRLLLTDRAVPNIVRPHREATTELLQAVDDLWTWVDQCYREAWGRPANAGERRWIGEHAFRVLRQ